MKNLDTLKNKKAKIKSLFTSKETKINKITDWQSDGVAIGKDRKEKDLFILCPPSAFLVWLAIPFWMGLVWIRKYIHSKLISKESSQQTLDVDI